MNLWKLFQKMFIGGTWYVGIRNHKDSDKKAFKIVEAPIGQWIADPFLYEFEGRHYLYVEQYIKEEKHACLGCYEIVDGVPSNYHVIIKNPYHMSYPCIFFYKGHHYIIPESSANNTVDLYEATDFPYGWMRKCTLLDGEKMVDSTVFFNGDLPMLLSYKSSIDGWYIIVFRLDIENGRLEKITETKYNSNTGRPAGLLYKKGDVLYRPSQDCSSKYGNSLIINQVDSLSDVAFKEHPVYNIYSNQVDIPINAQRIHTVNRDSKYEVVDLFQEKIDLLHIMKIVKRKFNL